MIEAIRVSVSTQVVVGMRVINGARARVCVCLCVCVCVRHRLRTAEVTSVMRAVVAAFT